MVATAFFIFCCRTVLRRLPCAQVNSASNVFAAHFQVRVSMHSRARADQDLSPSGATHSILTTGGTERDRIRSFLMAHLRHMMAARQLTQVQAAEWFHISQPRVSHLVNDRTNRFSTDTLLNMLGHAGVHVSVDFKVWE